MNTASLFAWMLIALVVVANGDETDATDDGDNGGGFDDDGGATVQPSPLPTAEPSPVPSFVPTNPGSPELVPTAAPSIATSLSSFEEDFCGWNTSTFLRDGTMGAASGNYYVFADGSDESTDDFTMTRDFGAPVTWVGFYYHMYSNSLPVGEASLQYWDGKDYYPLWENGGNH